MTTLALLRRIARKAREGELSKDDKDLDALATYVRQLEGKRKPARNINAERLALVLRLTRSKVMSEPHAIDAALLKFPGAAPSTVKGHLNPARKGSRKLIRLAETIYHDWCEDWCQDDAGQSQDASESKSSAKEDFLGP